MKKKSPSAHNEYQEGQETAPLRAFRLWIEYEGTAYCGWQRQENAPTIQQKLEEAMESLLKHPVDCPAAGRTDRGVHALGQVSRVVTPRANITADNLLRGGNTLLPREIRIQNVAPCALDFDPRRDARMRWYRYTVAHQPVAPALDRNRVTHVREAMDWDRVKEAMTLLEGQHDFQPFRASKCQAKRTELTMRRVSLSRSGQRWHLDFFCRSFLHNMIRILTGLLLEIGQGKLPVQCIPEMFASGKRTYRFRVAPAEGLVFMRVFYPEDGDFLLDSDGKPVLSCLCGSELNCYP